jgi:hypothetical protein
VDTGSREENASKQKVRSPVLIPSELEKLEGNALTDHKLFAWPPAAGIRAFTRPS